MNTNTGPDSSDTFEALRDELASWRGWMLRRYAGFNRDDIGAIIDESLWEHHLAGVRDRLQLRRKAETAVRRHARHELRFRERREPADIGGVEDSFEDRVSAAVDARASLRGLEIPERALAWVRHRCDPAAQHRISERDRCYGRRWAARVRAELNYAV